MPFGLLSAKAHTPFTIEGNRWDNVLSFVYVTLFQTRFQGRANQLLADNTYFPKIVELLSEEDGETFSMSIIDAQRVKFRDNPRFRNFLLETRDRPLTHSDANLVAFYTNARNMTGFAYDYIRKMQVPEEEIGRVLRGVREELMKNPNLSSNTNYSELIRYQARIADPVPTEVKKDINRIVSYVKNTEGEKIYNQNLREFKAHLLETYLDYILETEYPSVEKKDYPKAKSQQKEKNSDYILYGDRIYKLLKAGDVDKSITKRITMKEPIRFEKEEIPSSSDEIVIDGGPLAPDFLEDFTVDGKTFRSPVHYAYWRLFVLKGLMDMDVNAYSPDQLREEYLKYKDFWLRKRIIENYERASFLKFKDETLQKLLILTQNNNLEWGAKSDPILSEIFGKYLEFVRSQLAPPKKLVRDFKPFTSNIFFSTWLLWLASDYKTALNVVDHTQLYEIFNVKPVTPDGHPPVDLLKKAGMTTNDILSVWPHLFAYIDMIKDKTEMEAMSFIVKKRNEKLNVKQLYESVTSSLSFNDFYKELKRLRSVIVE